MTPSIRDLSVERPMGPALEFLRRIWRLNRSLEMLSARMERQLGVTAQQRLMLRCIGQNPGVSPGTLASVLHVDRGTVSATLTRLEAKGFVVRKVDARDGRKVMLTLSARGQRLDRPIEGSVEGAVDRLLARAAPSKIAMMVEVLELLTELVDEELSSPSNG